MMVIYEPIEYKNKKNIKKINEFINKVLQTKGIQKDFLMNWMEVYADELKAMRKGNNSNLILQKIANSSSLFATDVIISLNNDTQMYEIKASRFFIKYSNVLMNSKDAKVMNQLYELCSQSGLPIIPYSIVFKYYEQFEQTLPNILQAFVIATESMYFISLLFIPDIISVICIIFSMFSIMLGLVGFMRLWSLTLSSITMIELIMSIGFCVDFSAHLTHAFIAGVGKGTRNERAYRACIHTGLPVFNSATSTIIGICVLGFAKSYIFMTFFKTILLIMSLGVLNSMLFLPNLLSLVGPNWKMHQECKNNKVDELYFESKLNGNKPISQQLME